MKRNQRFCALIFLVMLMSACKGRQHEQGMKQAVDNLYSTDKDDHAMNQAMEIPFLGKWL